MQLIINSGAGFAKIVLESGMADNSAAAEAIVPAAVKVGPATHAEKRLLTTAPLTTESIERKPCRSKRVKLLNLESVQPAIKTKIDRKNSKRRT
jgi:hypothetical protein